MWNDEDNNPYGTSFDRRDSQTSSSANPASPTSRDFENVRPHTPSSGSDDEVTETARGHRSLQPDDEDDTAKEDNPPRRKPGGYDSRIEQMLYENPKLPILITDAGKSLESGGRYIVYTIRTGVGSCPFTHPTLLTIFHRIWRSGDAILNSRLSVML
jgi:hypothetical protein